MVRPRPPYQPQALMAGPLVLAFINSETLRSPEEERAGT
jgi:hypothetical protein